MQGILLLFPQLPAPESGEGLDRRIVQHLAGLGIPGTVAGAVPAVLLGIPDQTAAHVGAAA